MERWAIYIDIEGSSKIYARDEAQFWASMNALIDGICRIGSQVCPNDPDRLFVHQTGGDGFIIVSEFAQGSPDMPIAIATILMQTVLATGGIAKAGIAQGEFGDVQSLLPILQNYPPDENGRRWLGRGILRVFQVMGSALINAHRLATQKPRGARLAVDRAMISQMPPGLVVSHKSTELVVVDWIHTALNTAKEISAITDIELLPVTELESRLLAYVARAGNTVDEEWKHCTLQLNGCIDDSTKRHMKENPRLFDHTGLPIGDKLSDENPLPVGVQALIETRINAGISHIRAHNHDSLQDLARDHARKWRFLAAVSFLASILAWFYAPAYINKQVDEKITEPMLKESADRVMASKMSTYVDDRLNPLRKQALKLQDTLDKTRDAVEEKQNVLEQQQVDLSKQLRIRELAVAAKAGSRSSYNILISLQKDVGQPFNLLNASLKEIELFFDADRNQLSFPKVVISQTMKDPGYSVDEVVHILRTSPRLAEAAINTLSDLNTKGCVKELCKVVAESDDLRVAARATRAIQVITGERIRPLEFDKVAKWWEENSTNPIYNGSYDGYSNVVSSMRAKHITNAQLELFIDQLKITAASDPDALHSRCLAAGFLLMTGKFMIDKHAQALKLLDEVRSKRNDYRWLYVWEAAIECKANDVEKAVELINKAFERSPTSDVEETVRRWKIFAPVRKNEKINWPSKKDEVAHRDKNDNH